MTHTINTITFTGRSGERHLFQIWPFGTRFKAVGAVYIITERLFEDPTFLSKASHRPLAIGNTADLTTEFVTPPQLKALAASGGDHICVCVIADAARRAEVENDLIQGNERAGGHLRYLFDAAVPQRRPGPASSLPA